MSGLFLGLSEDFKEAQELLTVQKKVLSKEISDPENVYKIIQDIIKNSIGTALLKSEPIKSIRDQICYLCHTSFDIPPFLHSWAKQEVENANQKNVQNEDPAPCCFPTVEDKPLFSKDTLYHASLCCQAVSTCTTLNFKKFLNEKGHTLKEVSMSISKEDVDRYIIAKQGNTVYIAFQSKPIISSWSEDFIEGK